MKNNINKYIKKLSPITAHPETDWQKVFFGLVILAVISLGWNVYFYFAVKADIAASEQNGRSQNSKVSNVQEDEIKKVIVEYDARTAKNAAIIQSAPAEVADPAGA